MLIFEKFCRTSKSVEPVELVGTAIQWKVICTLLMLFYFSSSMYWVSCVSHEPEVADTNIFKFFFSIYHDETLRLFCFFSIEKNTENIGEIKFIDWIIEKKKLQSTK